MSKLAHSYTETMNQIEFREHWEDANYDLIPAHWWVRYEGKVQLAEFRYEKPLKNISPGGWNFHLIGGEVVYPLHSKIAVVDWIKEPTT